MVAVLSSLLLTCAAALLPAAYASTLTERSLKPGPGKFPLGTVTPKFSLPTKQKGWKTYKVPKSSDPDADDSTALIEALASGNYSVNATILFSEGHTYNIFTPIVFTNLTNVEVVIEGNITLPTNVTYIQETVASSSFSGYWFKFNGGTNIILRGSTNPKWGWVDGHGQLWWTTQNQTNRPHGWSFSKVVNAIIRDMKLWMPIAWNFSTSGSTNVHGFHNRIHAKSNGTGFPFNTDGFSAGGDTMLFEQNYIVNGDDCLTVGSGGKNVVFRDTYCEGGHGLSIGSLGSGGSVADVQNIWIENNYMQSTLYGARFKSWTGGNGLARNVTWKDIVFNDVPFPIYVTQNYWDQNKGPKPNSTSTNETAIQDFTFNGFTGVIRDKPYVEGTCITDPCWYYVANATGREVAIFDLYPGFTTNIVAKKIYARTQTGKEVDVMCNETTVTNDVGFKCWDGPFIRTKAGLKRDVQTPLPL